MPTIAVLGANGQVGSEVCLILSQMADVRVVPIVRTKLSASLLSRCGLECRIGSVHDGAQASSLLAGADVVADFSLPRGQASSAWKAARAHIASAIRHAAPSARYVYMSSTMAFGMNADERRYANRTISRTPYSAFKRRAERFALAQGRTHRRPVYVFRLGQVHGELQQVTRQLISLVTSGPVFAEKGGDIACDTVLCSTIASALVDLVRTPDPPKRYTVLENPDWTWKQTWEFCAMRCGVEARLLDSGSAVSASGGVRGSVGRVVRASLGAIRKHKEFLMAHVPMTAQLESRLKMRYLTARAATEIADATKRFMPTPHFLHGPVPGQRLTANPVTAAEARSALVRVGTLLDRCLGPSSHNFSAKATAIT